MQVFIFALSTKSTHLQDLKPYDARSLSPSLAGARDAPPVAEMDTEHDRRLDIAKAPPVSCL
jgi:hypothetical protein